MNASIPQPFEQVVHLSVTSETANLAKVRAAVTAAAQGVGFAEPDVSHIALAVDEALGNIIRHAYENEPGCPIDVTLERIERPQGRGLQITICDCGPQVDPQTIEGRALDDVRPGGLGTHIIKSVMDEVEYSFRQPEGMKLCMMKLLRPGSDKNVPECQSEGTADD